MKQKITIKLDMGCCEKCRNKAIKIASGVRGVTAVSLEGDGEDRLAVTGDDVEVFCLVKQLKKKFCGVIIISVEDVKRTEEVNINIRKEIDVRIEEVKKTIIEENRTWLMAALICTLCNSSSCHGKCGACSKCHKSNCDGACVIVCVNCEKPTCKGQCKESCSNCHNPKCDGCKPPTPPCTPCYPCPPHCTCSRCYLPYQPCNPYPFCLVVYDPNPDSCSIM